MRNFDPERVPKESRDGEPVSQPSDHSTLARGSHVRKPRVFVLKRERDHEDDGHDAEDAQRDALHAAQLGEATEVVGGHCPQVAARAW